MVFEFGGIKIKIYLGWTFLAHSHVYLSFCVGFKHHLFDLPLTVSRENDLVFHPTRGREVRER